MIEKIEELLKMHRGTQTTFQNRFFVIQKQKTLYAQFKQSLRELDGRISNLRTQSFAYERHLLELEELEYKISISDGFEKRRYEIDLREKGFQTPSLERGLKENEEDVETFYKSAILLKEEIENEYGSIEKEVLDRLEVEDWKEKVRGQIALDWQLTGQLSKASYEFLDSLPGEHKKEIVGEMKNQQKFISDFEDKEPFEIDTEKMKQLSLDTSEIKKLL
jgi:hypothetical protein